MTRNTTKINNIIRDPI